MSEGGRRKTAWVTGGNGYIASALIEMLLNKGYSVKTTVRDPDDVKKNSHLEELRALGPLEIFRADLDIMGSFDEAVAGCDYAFLVAAPMEQNPEDPDSVVEAAVRGASNVISSCVRAGSVKRVILTSSIAAVGLSGRLPQGEGHVLDEESWSDVDFLRAYAKSGAWAYPVSKVLVEKEACKLALEKGISLVTVCPVITTGKAPAANAQASIPLIVSLLSDLGEKPRVYVSSTKLIREGFEYKYNTLEEIYHDVVDYARATGILPS